MSEADDSTKAIALQLPSPVQAISPQWRNANCLQLFVKRDDLIHPIVSGNKWRKLAPQLARLSGTRPVHVISFGGGFSNHLHSLSFCCAHNGFRFTAMVRGDYRRNLTPMLRDCERWGSEIRFLTKAEYARRTEEGFINSLKSQNPGATLIPEGGSHPDCLTGMQMLADELTQQIGQVDALFVPVASGGTLAGLAAARGQTKQLIGVAVLKGQQYLESLVEGLLTHNPRKTVNTSYRITHDFHHGGYAKAPHLLKCFCDEHSEQLNLPLEPIYSGKALFAMRQFVESGYFTPGQKVVFLHTGGIQGTRPLV
ncbi:1-aminocyclopropane-1-carboxylate deaminase/D-cysteine desulfhydrase [Alteromonas oceanisediminis]|uniref:1-aminocyclopropane-1-carboxylate deaminase/D-cysteine desulfhydrase n=1 Tax=Alteromonas oceanisediminis TaxID=2836180 RepID=UPI001BDA12EB|nr:pyridoxal-phosphate dependent enzyme [Alteromonas oceanisediminis]MBT0585468.1 pyridoxal-phosphate dependent enzyme [Alteromonas oceanisediminis]